MGSLLIGAAGLMGGTWLLRALVPAAAPALRACRLGGLWGVSGSCGALRLLPEVTLGLGESGSNTFPRSERPYLDPRSIGIL